MNRTEAIDEAVRRTLQISPFYREFLMPEANELNFGLFYAEVRVRFRIIIDDNALIASTLTEQSAPIHLSSGSMAASVEGA